MPSELLGHQPDLISAAATNGKEGYVRREDFMLEPSAIETNGKPFMIPKSFHFTFLLSTWKLYSLT